MTRHVQPTQRSVRAIVEIAGQQVPLSVDWRRQARRFTLRLDPRTGGARITVPLNTGIDDAISFLRRHESWLVRERSSAYAPVAFVAGAVVPLRGVDHEIRLAPASGRRVWTEAEAPDDGTGGTGCAVLWVSGAADMVAIRTTRYLKEQARSELEARARIHAEQLGLAFSRIVIRDQRTRWGSCSSTGTLSFSWRLIMTPPHVLDYVAAHEVAHLAEMNHSPRFWRLVRRTVPDSKAARMWLAANGNALHGYGAPA